MQNILCLEFVNWLDVYRFNPDPQKYLLEDTSMEELQDKLKDSVLIICHMALTDVTIKKDLEKLNQIRSITDIPVMVFCYGTQKEKMCRIFEYGAIDYITPKTDLMEVKSRMYGHISRYLHVVWKDQFNVLTRHGIELNLNDCTVQYKGKDISVTTTEFQILEQLLRNVGHVVADDELFQSIWHRSLYEQKETNQNCLAVHVSKIKSKLGLGKDNELQLIRTSKVGYSIKLSEQEN